MADEVARYASCNTVLAALIAADPDPAERWAMLTYLCGYSPDGILCALERLAEERAHA